MSAETSDTEARLRRLAADLGCRIERFERLHAGLGLRRFLRLHLSGGGPPSAVARIDAPEDPAGRPAGVPPEPPLEPLRTRLEEAGIPVPARLGSDPEAGIELLEDVGDRSMLRALPGLSAAERRRLYEEACDLVPRLQGIADPGDLAAFERRLDAPLFAYKAELFARWGLPAGLGRAPSPAEASIVSRAFARVFEICAAGPWRLAHRDLQSANLHMHPSPGRGSLVVIDLQGAFLAPPEYDLVCLLRDSYVELPEEEVAFQVARIRPRLPDAPDAATFARRFDLLTLTRKAKDHARYRYAALERGERAYLDYVPAAARALRGAAARARELGPPFTDLAELLETLPEDPR